MADEKPTAERWLLCKGCLGVWFPDHPPTEHTALDFDEGMPPCDGPYIILADEKETRRLAVEQAAKVAWKHGEKCNASLREAKEARAFHAQGRANRTQAMTPKKRRRKKEKP